MTDKNKNDAKSSKKNTNAKASPYPKMSKANAGNATPKRAKKIEKAAASAHKARKDWV